MERTFRLVAGCSSLPVVGAATLVAYPNGTRLTGRTNTQGVWRPDLYSTDLEMRFLAAASGFLPFDASVVPTHPTTILRMTRAPAGLKAVLFTASTGHIPGIEGRLNPINDDGRMYVYADNIAINGRPAHPAQFQIGESLHLVDVYGVETTICFRVVTSQFSLIEYTEPTPYRGE